MYDLTRCENCKISVALLSLSLQIQCNVFEGANGEVALTAAGGLRQLPGLTETFENAALVSTVYSVMSSLNSDIENNTALVIGHCLFFPVIPWKEETGAYCENM